MWHMAQSKAWGSCLKPRFEALGPSGGVQLMFGAVFPSWQAAHVATWG
jgi:hypothetical protein